MSAITRLRFMLGNVNRGAGIGKRGIWVGLVLTALWLVIAHSTSVSLSTS